MWPISWKTLGERRKQREGVVWPTFAPPQYLLWQKHWKKEKQSQTRAALQRGSVQVSQICAFTIPAPFFTRIYLVAYSTPIVGAGLFGFTFFVYLLCRTTTRKVKKKKLAWADQDLIAVFLSIKTLLDNGPNWRKQGESTKIMVASLECATDLRR